MSTRRRWLHRLVRRFGVTILLVDKNAPPPHSRDHKQDDPDGTQFSEVCRYVRVGLLASMELPFGDGRTAESKTPEIDAYRM